MLSILTKMVSILGILGVPSIFVMVSWCMKRVLAESKNMKILMAAQQAQMRSQLLKDYYTYTNRGYIYESELSDWENQYQAYHALGANGIIDNRRERLFKLDIKEEIK